MTNDVCDREREDPLDGKIEEKYRTLEVDPAAPRESTEALTQHRSRQQIVACVVFLLALIVAALVFIFGNGNASDEYALDGDGFMFRGGFAGLVVVVGALLAWRIATSPVRHK